VRLRSSGHCHGRRREARQNHFLRLLEAGSNEGALGRDARQTGGVVKRSGQQQVGRRLREVGKLLASFQIAGEVCPSKAVEAAMHEAERAFSEDDHERAAHLTVVVVLMIERDLNRFRADPEGWTFKRKLLAI
jgi:hypothetical protein